MPGPSQEDAGVGPNSEDARDATGAEEEEDEGVEGDGGLEAVRGEGPDEEEVQRRTVPSGGDSSNGTAAVPGLRKRVPPGGSARLMEPMPGRITGKCGEGRMDKKGCGYLTVLDIRTKLCTGCQ